MNRGVELRRLLSLGRWAPGDPNFGVVRKTGLNKCVIALRGLGQAGCMMEESRFVDGPGARWAGCEM